MASTTTKPSRLKVQAHRARMRAMGLRPLQIWVPDTSAPGFAEECARQCMLVAASPETELDAWLHAANAQLADDLDANGL